MQTTTHNSRDCTSSYHHCAIINMISFLKSLLALYGAPSIRLLSTSMAAIYLVGILILVGSCVVASTLVLYRLLCCLVCYLCSFQKLFWLRIGVGLLLLFAIPLSALAFVKLCITIVAVGPTTILTTLFIVSIVGMVMSFVVLFVLRLLHLLYRLFCSLYRLTTAWTRERQKKLVLVEMETNVEETDFQQQDSDLEEVELETEETLVDPRVVEEIDVPTVPTEVHLSASHSSTTLRRSFRIRRPPDRWVPPSGRTVQMVPHGSFFDHGVRRSGRIAARLAKL